MRKSLFVRYLSDLIITPSCVKRITDLHKKNSNIKLRLRITVDSGGCSGFQYKFNLDDTDLQSGDKVVIKDGVEVVVDDVSLEFMKGSTIDYDRGMMRSSFTVTNNPLSETACGCGTSFAKKSFSKNSV